MDYSKHNFSPLCTLVRLEGGNAVWYTLSSDQKQLHLQKIKIVQDVDRIVDADASFLC